jgi:hypothetical protein
MKTLKVRSVTHDLAHGQAGDRVAGAGKPIPEFGLHQILFRFSQEDYTQLGQIWNGAHSEDGTPLEVQDAIPEGAPPPDLEAEPQLTSPLGEDIDPGMFASVASKLFGDSVASGVSGRAANPAFRPSGERRAFRARRPPATRGGR